MRHSQQSSRPRVPAPSRRRGAALVGGALLALLAVLAGCHSGGCRSKDCRSKDCRAPEPTSSGPVAAAVGQQPSGPSPLRLGGAPLLRSISPQDLDREGRPFVEVTLHRITNPDRVPVHFELTRLRPGEPALVLGTFAPFPPDNPGTFLVAAADLLAAGDQLSLELVPVDERDAERAGIEVELERFTLVAR
jgi:hypothetical protein